MANEVSICNNQNWLSVHGYFVKDWVRVSILLSLTRLIGWYSSKNCIDCCLHVLYEYGGLSVNNVGNRLVWVDADKASTS